MTREDWIRAIDGNMLKPIFLIRAVVDGMIARGFGRIINITTMGVKSPGTYPQLGVSIGVRSGLTGFIGVLSRQAAHHNVTISGLLPGRFETDRLSENLEFAARAAGHSTEDEAERVRATIPARRFGQVEEFGAFAAFLCSTHAGYLTGQNIVLDGGGLPGVDLTMLYDLFRSNPAARILTLTDEIARTAGRTLHGQPIQPHRN